jgi:phage shock protein A
MGWRWTDDGEKEQPGARGKRNRGGKRQRATDGGYGTGKEGGATEHSEHQLDANGLPAAGRGEYLACSRCRRWYYCYGLTAATCTGCSQRFSNEALRTATRAGAVITGAPTYKEALQGSSESKGKSKGKGSSSAGHALSELPLAAEPVAAERGQCPLPGYGAQPSVQQLQHWINKLQEQGLLQTAPTLQAAEQPEPVREPAPVPAKQELGDPLEKGEADSYKAVRALENKRAKARVQWRRAVAGFDQHIKNLEEANDRAKKLEEKLQAKVHEAKEQMAERKARLDELEVELAQVQCTHSKMADNYSTGKCTTAILQQVSAKQPADAAAKVWSTLQGQIDIVLESKVLGEAEKNGIQCYVAEALLAAKVQLHAELEKAGGYEDFEMDDGSDSVELQPDTIFLQRNQPLEPAGGQTDEADRGSPWVEQLEDAADCSRDTEQGREHPEEPPSKALRRTELP